MLDALLCTLHLLNTCTAYSVVETAHPSQVLQVAHPLAQPAAYFCIFLSVFVSADLQVPR